MNEGCILNKITAQCYNKVYPHVSIKMQDTGRFFKVYSNLPMNVRKEIVLVIDDQPISWAVAYNEIVNKTEVGRKIFKKLIELEII